MTTLAHDEHRSTFERIRTDGWMVFEEWKNDGMRESVRLEFKSKSNPATSGLSDHDRSELARSVCALANTSGGIVGFGFDTKTGKKGEPDALMRLLPIADVKRCAARINEELHEWFEPVIRGLDVLDVTDTTSNDGSGVIVIHVPASEGGPHRVSASNVEAHTGDHYFMRTSSSTVVMPHSMLTALFGRRPEPRLHLPSPAEVEERVLDLHRLARTAPAEARQVLGTVFGDGMIKMLPQQDGSYLAKTEILPLLLIAATRNPRSDDPGGGLVYIDGCAGRI